MYTKIAFENVKKSFKDYSIYFLTLTFAVCIFYSFNSIESQKAIIEISLSSKDYAQLFIDLMSYISVFVSFILGSLMIYANNFLIKRRKKELGVYMILGMGKRKISTILVLETLLVAIVSLISGLLLGLLTSQGISLLIINMFKAPMDSYSFSISFDAILKTINYFGIMFLIVMLFNNLVIKKYKIIDLLNASKKVETIKIKNPAIYLVIFLLSVISLGIAYKLVLEVGLQIDDIKFKMSIVLGILGTFLFFFSLSGFILFVAKKNKDIYFKNLNIFVIKQLNSKVKTNFMSISVICLMLFFTIGILSTGLGMKNAMENSLKGATPFDASIYMYITEGDKVKSIKESLDKVGFEFGKDDKYDFYDIYSDKTKVTDIIPELSKTNFNEITVDYIKLTDYNEILSMLGKDNVELKDDEVLIMSNMQEVKKVIDKYLKDNNIVKIDDKEYKVKSDKAIEQNLRTDYMQNNIFTIVINDEFCKDLDVEMSVVNINYSDESHEDIYSTNLDKLYKEARNELGYENVGFAMYGTREDVYSQTLSMSTTMVFVGIYLGIVFLISSMAVLGLQQLSEASDSIDRYVAIKKIGASEKSINKTIFIQTLLYFSLPICLALVHSVVGIKVANEFVAMYGTTDIGTSSIITALLLLVVYISYFFATYIGYKNIIKSKIN